MTNKNAEKTIQGIGRVLKMHKPYLFTIDEAVRDFGSGIMRVELRIYQGFVTDVVLQEYKRIVFKRPVDTAGK